MRLLTASFRKLLHRPATRITFVVLLALVAFVLLSIGASVRAIDDPSQLAGVEAILQFPEAFGSLAAMLVVFVGLAAAAYGAAIAGSEWSWQTFRLAVARGESRPRYVFVTFAAVALLVLIGWVVLFAAGVALIPVAAGLAGVEVGDPTAPGGLGRLPLLVVAGWWAVVMEGAIGFAVAFVARSQVAGVVIVIALYLAEQFASIVLPADLLRLAPISAASGLVAEAGRSAGEADLLVPLIMTTLYLGLAIAAASLYARRTEVA